MKSIELRAFALYIASREEQYLIQFFMALCSDFEALCGAILSCNPFLSVESVVSESLAKEIRLKSQVGKGISTSHTFVLVVSFGLPSKPPSNKQNKPYSRVAIDECSYRKQQGHWKAQYPMILPRIMQHQPSQQSQQSQFNINQQRFYRPLQSNTIVVVPPSNLFESKPKLSFNPTIDSLVEQFQKLLTTLQSKMVLLKENIDTLLKLLVLFYHLHVFLLNFKGMQFLLHFT